MAEEHVQVNVLYFAAASTATGLDREQVPVPANCRLSSLGDLLVARHPEAANLREILAGSKWSVDAEMVDSPDAVVLQGGEEIAVICPVSGG